MAAHIALGAASVIGAHGMSVGSMRRAFYSYYSQCNEVCLTREAVDKLIAEAHPYYPSMTTVVSIALAAVCVATAAAVVSRSKMVKGAEKA